MDNVSCGHTLHGDTHCEKLCKESIDFTSWSNGEAAEITLPGQNVPLFSEEDVLKVIEAERQTFIPSGGLQQQISACNVPSDEKVLEPQQNKKVSCFSSPLDTKKQKSLSKSATFPSQTELDEEDLSVGACCMASGTDIQVQCSSTTKNATYGRSVSLPATFNLISAMKGSRQQDGSLSNEKLHVKWAPDVYDPPCTSMSHTVRKNHYQRPKAKKRDNNKHKQKGRSKRVANKSSVSNTAESVKTTRLQNAGDNVLLNGYEKSNLEVEYAVNSQDSKCGSSFLREALAKVHISITEAT